MSRSVAAASSLPEPHSWKSSPTTAALSQVGAGAAASTAAGAGGETAATASSTGGPSALASRAAARRSCSSSDEVTDASLASSCASDVPAALASRSPTKTASGSDRGWPAGAIRSKVDWSVESTDGTGRTAWNSEA